MQPLGLPNYEGEIRHNKKGKENTVLNVQSDTRYNPVSEVLE
jgi:hypothetical protein